MVDRLTNLIAIFENKVLDFSKNRAEGDDILGDAYEYLMWHFATESGKSKGQFYPPAEVSRVIAQILGIRQAKTTSEATATERETAKRLASFSSRQADADFSGEVGGGLGRSTRRCSRSEKTRSSSCPVLAR